MRPHVSRPKVNRASGRVQQRGIGVPLIDGRGDAPIRTRKPLDGGNGLGASDDRGELLAVVAQLRDGLSTSRTGQIEGVAGVLLLPLGPDPFKPVAPGVNVAESVGVLLGEAICELVLGILGRDCLRRCGRRPSPNKFHWFCHDATDELEVAGSTDTLGM